MAVRLNYELIAILFIIITLSAAEKFPKACKVFCGGKLLDLVQKAHLYKDSKTFVNMKMVCAVDTVVSDFQKLEKTVKDGEPSVWALRMFVRKYFRGPGMELIPFQPHDWKEDPKILDRIHDVKLKDWAKELHSYWFKLGRIVKPFVREHPDQYSLVYVPNPIIIPADTFTEFHCWDTYWILLGLLRSEMYTTAKGILENLSVLAYKFGFIPFEGRIYYLSRSEPPLLLPMFKLYHEFTRDDRFIESHIDTLEREFRFWRENRCVNITVRGDYVTLAHYDSHIAKPRPEAYTEDINLASKFSSKTTRNEVYMDLSATSESGWDFSSRWLVHNNSQSKDLMDIKTRDIIPVDLNAILCWNADILAEFFEISNEYNKSLKYKKIAFNWKKALNWLLWNENDGTWYDYDKQNHEQRKHFYASNLMPLWTQCYDKTKTNHIASKVVDYMTYYRVTYYEGGVPVSLYRTGFLYDFPTVVPPLQHIIIMGLKYTENSEAEELAFKLAFNWLRANYKGFFKSGLMFDTYHAEKPGVYSGKTAYNNKIGYGWTNGVCLDLLYTYGSVIHSKGIKNGGLPNTEPTSVLIIYFFNFMLIFLIYF